MCPGSSLLDDFRVRRVDGMAQPQTLTLQRVGRVDDDFARQVAETLGDFANQQSRHSQHDDSGTFDRLGLSRDGRSVTRFLDQRLRLIRGRVARTVDDRVALRRKLGAQRRGDITGTDDGDSIRCRRKRHEQDEKK